MEPSRRDQRALTVLCLACYFFIGTLATLFPSILPAVIRGFGLSLAAAGLVFPANSVGSLIGGVLTGIWSDRIGRRPFLFGSALLSGLSLLGASSARHWPLFVGCFLILGAAQGALANSTNALVLDLNVLRQRKALNTLHGLYSLGATVSPFVIKWALGPGINWRAVVFWTACVWLGLSLTALGFHYPPATATRAGQRAFRMSLLFEGPFALLFAVAFCYNGVAWALLGWVKEYLQGAGARPAFASGMISLFYLGLTLGRFACARISEQLSDGKTLLILAIGTTLAYPLATFGSTPFAIACGVFLSGLSLSGLYPTALACATRIFPSIPGTVTGTLSVAMTLGGSLPPWWTGAIGGAYGLAYALRFNYLLVLPLISIGLVLRKQETPRRAEETVL